MGTDAESGDRTVDTHIKTLRAKLKALRVGLDRSRRIGASGNRLINHALGHPSAVCGFAIIGLAAFFVLTVFVNEIKPSVAEVMEDVMIDSAHMLAGTGSARTGEGNDQQR